MRFYEPVTAKGRRVELRMESTTPEHQPVLIDLKLEAFEIAGVAVGAVIGDDFNRPEYDLRTA